SLPRLLERDVAGQLSFRDFLDGERNSRHSRELCLDPR
uniref:Uncharacterized protein n=1 Tax=Acrobeloides nanus TaxID=290746 RepID=A0A914DIK6_9BILA